MDTSFAPLSFKLSPPDPEPQSQAPKAQPIQQQHYTATLHSIKKQPVKPWRRPEQLPPRVYCVEPRGFRKLVQRLTGKPPRQARPRLLRDTVRMPPPLELAPRSLPQPQMQSVGYHNASSIDFGLELYAPSA
ncbi:hypothetical protein J5N97_010079 [Dioscorea zingiberensis]|uniref:VQ domain-containing protein n=1 Tax=Dioscorea zingiberensis TaxID=325984 RepID=A0A9D5CZF2_9LILI|nr:hypothetical protein J5N97_010079 [Dioscorea zingiberensis]